MTIPVAWQAAFPIQPASKAVEVLKEAWSDLSRHRLIHFNEKTNEAQLTKKLKIHVENVTAPQHGLLGTWSAEDIMGDVCPITGSMINERRTDIVYGWNDSSTQLKLVFEFKRLGKQKSHRDHYLQDRGLGRFVTGIYSRKQAVAAMVGILLDPEIEVVPPIRKALEDKKLALELRLRPAANGAPYTQPSTLFAHAHFDTEHDRDPALAPTHGHILVSHFFFSFGYPTTTKKPKKLKTK